MPVLDEGAEREAEEVDGSVTPFLLEGRPSRHCRSVSAAGMRDACSLLVGTCMSTWSLVVAEGGAVVVAVAAERAGASTESRETRPFLWCRLRFLRPVVQLNEKRVGKPLSWVMVEESVVSSFASRSAMDREISFFSAMS